MFIALKCFASEKISASKGKVIDIKDKSISDALLKAGLIAPISKKEMSNKEKDEEIQSLKSQINDKETELKNIKAILDEKDEEIKTLNEIIAELEQNKQDSPEAEKIEDELTQNNDNLDNTDSSDNEDNKKNDNK